MYIHTKTTYKGVLNLDTAHYHDVLIFKKESMEVDSSIEALDLTLQRGATSSKIEKASSFSYERFLENHTYYHTTHGLMLAMFPISQAVHLKDQDLLHHKVNYIYISIIPITLLYCINLGSLSSNVGVINIHLKK